MASPWSAARRRVERIDDALVRAMRAHGVLALRLALGVVFLWFGLLKVAGASPVADLVARVVPLPATTALLALGALEAVVGAGLVLGVAMRAVLALFWLQLAGTFLVLVLQPGIAFQGGNPLLLTMEGEFVVKNLVLIAAGLVVGGTVRRLRTQRLRAQRGVAA